MIRHSQDNGISVYEGADRNTIRGNTITNAAKQGISLYKAADDNTIHDNTINGAGEFGIVINDGDEQGQINGGQVTYNRIYSSTKDGIRFSWANKITVANNEIDNAGDNGISLYRGSDENEVRDNTITNPSNQGISLAHASDGNFIYNNTVRESGKHGIVLNKCIDNTIKGNKVYDSGENGISVTHESQGNEISENTVERSTNQGISLYKGAHRSFISTNTVSASGKYGIVLNASSDCHIYNNYCHSNNQSNGQSSNIALTYGSNNNKIEENTCRIGTGYPEYGIFIAGDTSGNTLLNNDLANSGTKGPIYNGQQ